MKSTVDNSFLFFELTNRKDNQRKNLRVNRSSLCTEPDIRKYCKYGGHRILVQFWMKRMNFLELGEVVVVEEWQIQETRL